MPIRSRSYKIVKDINDNFDSDAAWDVEQLKGLAQKFATACNELMKRAAECDMRLEEGKKHEAAKIAKLKPSLKTEVELLDFPNINDWIDTCDELGFDTPDNFDPDYVRQVLEQLGQLGDDVLRLVDLHTRLSLGLAPLDDRIEVLRSLMEKDHVNEFWKNDLMLFEEARLDDIRNQAKSASDSADLGKLKRIIAELHEYDWHIQPDSCIKYVEKITWPHIKRDARQRYERLLAEIHEAYAQLNEKRCRDVFRQWSMIEKETSVAPDDDMSSQINQVKEWFGEQEREREEEKAYEQACLQLESALEGRGVGMDELERLTANVLRFERGIPELLAARLNSRREELKLAARRVFIFKMSAVAAAVVIFAAAIFFFVVLPQRRAGILRERIIAADDLLNELISEEADKEAAEKKLRKLELNDNKVYSDIRIQSHEKILEQLREFYKEVDNLDAMLEEDMPKSAEVGPLLSQISRLGKNADGEWINWRVQNLVEDLREKRDEVF